MKYENDASGARKASWALVLFLLCALGLNVACTGVTNNSATGEELQPVTRDRQIALNFTRMLELRHVSRAKIDVGVCERGLELYLKALDPTKIYFLQSDVDQFTADYAQTMALRAKKGDVEPGFVIYNTFLKRLSQRCETAQKLLEENNFDFDVDEYFERDKKTATYPANEEEALDRMRKRVKFELLALEAENRDKDKNAELNDSNEDQQNVVDATRPDDPVSKLKRRYSTLLKRMQQTTNDDLLEIYLTAIANSYDPHTTYMSPKSYENFMIQIGLNLEGIGATLQWDDGYTIVKRIVKGSPAEKQGELKVEDKIVGVGQGPDGDIEDVVDMKLTDVVDKIRGKGGTIVRLEVVSQDGKKKVISIMREKVDLEDSAAQAAIFTLYLMPDGSTKILEEGDANVPTDAVSSIKIGVVDLPSFYLDMKSKNSTTGRSVSVDMRHILEDFNAKQVDACIVDLRYNGGGSLPEAVSLTGLFIKTGAVVQTKPSEFGDRPRSLNDPDPDIVWTKPLVVLTSRLSASASEIFAGAIKDYQRGIIVGDETTHGKGSVQSMNEIAGSIFGNLMRETPNLGAIKVTIQGYYLPAGESPQLQGVRSDVVLPQFTSALEDIAESDLDYPLTFQRVDPAKYPNFHLTEASVLDAVRAKSQERVDASPDFQDEIEKIELYKDSKLRKEVPLNREKYFEELDKLNANKTETDKMEEIVNGDSGVKRDYYLDETLFLTRDYADALRLQTAL
ncbi:MAG: carboxy terminal-processing peptidase [Planctomycetia bacterium]|nr:carboxy terminal-processing peptidase [Planctomycetia bacterium]